MVCAVEEGVRPVAILGLHGLLEPLLMQVVLILAADALLHHDAVVVKALGIRTEPMSFLRVIVLAKADATAAYMGIQFHNTFHDALHAFWTL